MIGCLAVVLFILALACVYFSRKERDGDRSTVHVAENALAEDSQDNQQDEPKNRSKEETSKEGNNNKNNKNKNRKKRGEEANARSTNKAKQIDVLKPKANQVVLAAAVPTNGNVSSIPEISTARTGISFQGFPALAGSGFSQVQAVTNNAMLPVNQEFPVDLTGDNRYAPMHNVQRVASGNASSPGIPGISTAQTGISSQGFPAPAGFGFSQVQAVTNNAMLPLNQELPVNLTGDNRYAPKYNVQSSGPGVSQSLSAATGGGLFRSSQARVNLWNFMVIDNSSVERGKRLGQGAYAEVYEGKVRGLKCAIKLYRSTASQKQLNEAMREIKLAASLEHPCTLRLIGWVRQPLQTITELCLGDLKDFYKDKIEGLHYSEVRALMLLRVSFPSRFLQLA